ncbi:8607_t:CDS:1 [Funneliformis mosseae]|uniref:8607_t:CDS:1 n=1 Tax=Funneliformis mosseae TaxID=27381 RepID=A0A9N9BC50_FUNMO|nr:8607_t:CDS:1 [Funneliformis mosseae]
MDQYSKFTSDELMNAEEFILIDDDDNYGEVEITDEEIVNMIKSNEIDLEEEELISQPKISTSKALVSLDKVLSFLNNSPDTFITELHNKNLLYNLKKKIILFDKNNRVQTVLDGWLNI